jgi:hypothetical protein
MEEFLYVIFSELLLDAHTYIEDNGIHLRG